MEKEYLNICQVSLDGNLPIILQNVRNFKKFYDNVNFFVIVPSRFVNVFKEKIYFDNVNIISEDDIITLEEFKQISNKYFKKNIYFKEIQNRLSWYYQQILKISFVINFIEGTKKNIIIWDADTVIIDKIVFFKNNQSVLYGNTSEFHKAYYKTNLNILGSAPKYFISSLSQFIALSTKEYDYFKKLTNLNYKNKDMIGRDLSHLIMRSISNVHIDYNGSMFSEFELIGHSNLLNNFKKQKLISGIRDNLSGALNKNQMTFLKLLGFKYIAYEHTHNNINSQGMLDRSQNWSSLIKILIKKISNNFFRGLRHHLRFYYH